MHVSAWAKSRRCVGGEDLNGEGNGGMNGEGTWPPPPALPLTCAVSEVQQPPLHCVDKALLKARIALLGEGKEDVHLLAQKARP